MALPRPYEAMKKTHPALMKAYEAFGAACAASGPLDARSIAIIKLAVSFGAGLEGAAHSHARKALAAGWSAEDLLHAARLCAPTIGFPAMMRARQWVGDVVESPGRKNRKPASKTKNR